jgi:VanZ family protein
VGSILARVSRRLLHLALLFALAGLLLFVPLPIAPTSAGRSIENAGHVPLFFLVTMGVIYILRADERYRGWRLYLVAGAVGIGVGFLTEVLQRPLARDASWDDVGADAVGVVFALAVYALFDRISNLQRWHRLVALGIAVTCLVAYLAPIVTMVRAYLHRAAHFPVIASFDSRVELYWTLSIGVRRRIVDGVLEVDFVADETPGIGFHEPVPDWRGFRWLLIDVENPAEESLRLGVRVHDDHHNRQFNDRFNRGYDLRAGERKTLRVSLEEVRRGPRHRPMDMAHISNVTLFRGATTGSRRLRVHSIRLE